MPSVPAMKIDTFNYKQACITLQRRLPCTTASMHVLACDAGVRCPVMLYRRRAFCHIYGNQSLSAVFQIRFLLIATLDHLAADIQT